MKGPLLAAGLVSAILLACGPSRANDDARGTPPQRNNARMEEPIRVLPAPVVVEPAQVLLGERLFHDPRLSANDTVSCASCHKIAEGGDDGARVSKGVDGRQGVINSPTVFNTGFHIAQFWDGHAPTMMDQIEDPIHHPLEMATNWPAILAKLRRDPSLAATFEAVYGRDLDAAGIKAAIVAYERSLTTPDSPFDRYLLGDDDALTAEQLEGYALFKSYGCVACHQGRNVGANMYAKIGLLRDYFEADETPSKADLGRYNVTHNPQDRYVFKVPSLRLVTRTAPYFHDGRAETLEDAIAVMGKVQLGRAIPDQEVKLIIEFLRTLEGPYQRVTR